MDRICKFSVLRYVPNDIRQEFINIGVVLHSPEDKFIDCLITNNYSRVKSFDDEIDLPFLKIVLSGVKDDFSKTSVVSGPSFEDIADRLYLEKATSIYVNQLQFSEIKQIRSRDLEADLLKLFKMYVYFDVQKKSRITDQEVKTIMNRVIRSKTHHLFHHFDRNIKVDIGAEQIELDYAYKTMADRLKIVKTFSFDYTQRGSKQASVLAKEWAYNFNKLKSKSNFEEQYNTKLADIDLTTLVYVGDYSKNVKVAMQILNEETQTVEAHNQKEIENFAVNMANELHNINETE